MDGGGSTDNAIIDGGGGRWDPGVKGVMDGRGDRYLVHVWRTRRWSQCAITPLLLTFREGKTDGRKDDEGRKVKEGKKVKEDERRKEGRRRKKRKEGRKMKEGR
jgi:hypothetical protein